MKRYIQLLIAFLILPFINFSQNIEAGYFLSDRNSLQQFTGNYSDTLELIHQLLKCKGNRELNLTWGGYTTPDQPRIIQTNSKGCPFQPYCSNQLVALFLISALYYKNIGFCRQVMLKYYKKNGVRIFTTNVDVKFYPENSVKNKNGFYSDFRYSVTDKKVIRKAFHAYKKWFRKVKDEGLNKMRKEKVDPLKGTCMMWVK